MARIVISDDPGQFFIEQLYNVEIFVTVTWK